MMMIEEFKKDINNSLKEIQESTGKQVEALKRGDSQLKGPVSVFNKIIEENFPNLKKAMPFLCDNSRPGL